MLEQKEKTRKPGDIVKEDNDSDKVNYIFGWKGNDEKKTKQRGIEDRRQKTYQCSMYFWHVSHLI